MYAHIYTSRVDVLKYLIRILNEKYKYEHVN